MASRLVIERCVGESGACLTRFALIGKVDGRSTVFIDDGLNPATAYTYRVHGVNAAGKSAPTAPETALTFPPTLRRPCRFRARRPIGGKDRHDAASVTAASALRERLRASEERSRRVEEALRQSHEKFAKAFQSSPDFARVLAG